MAALYFRVPYLGTPCVITRGGVLKPVKKKKVKVPLAMAQHTILQETMSRKIEIMLEETGLLMTSVCSVRRSRYLGGDTVPW